MSQKSSPKTPAAIRGTQDIFGAEAEAFAFVVETFERVRKLYRFRRIEMPVFERTEVFSRAIGETTDVVSKEMYSFEDRGGESLTLRPEFTAGIARAFITDGWQQHAPLKVATHGPLFRYERPQKGRYRQFHQLDAEIIGAGEPQADVELLAMADQLLKELGIADGVTLQPQHARRWRQPRSLARGAGRLLSRRCGASSARIRRSGSKRTRCASSIRRTRATRRSWRMRRRSTITSLRKRRTSSARLPPASMPLGWRGNATPRSSAASTTTATPRSNSSPTGSARRAPCSAAGATTG